MINFEVVRGMPKTMPVDVYSYGLRKENAVAVAGGLDVAEGCDINELATEVKAVGFQNVRILS